MSKPDAVEIRVLGCLIEKQRTTPDAYPLSLNALRLACNQSTNRDPVFELDEGTVRDAVQRLGRLGWARLASAGGSRASKYRHLLDRALALGPDELALLAVLMLRGPQTAGELRQRSGRLHRFEDAAAVQAALDRLVDKGHVALLPREPGQKGQRYRQLLGGDGDEGAGTTAEAGAAPLGAELAREGPGGDAGPSRAAPDRPILDDPAAAPPPAGRYSHLASVDLGVARLLVVSGQVAIGPDGGLVGEGSMTAQCERVFESLAAILDAHGAGFADVINIRSYLTDLDRLDEYAAVRRRYLGDARPTSTTVEVSRLVIPEALVEVELLALRPGAGAPTGRGSIS